MTEITKEELLRALYYLKGKLDAEILAGERILTDEEEEILDQIVEIQEAKPKLVITSGNSTMKTWTCKSFIGHYPVGTALVVTAEDVDMAIIWAEKKLASIGLPQKLTRAQLVPLPTHQRHVRVLCDGGTKE